MAQKENRNIWWIGVESDEYGRSEPVVPDLKLDLDNGIDSGNVFTTQESAIEYAREVCEDDDEADRCYIIYVVMAVAVVRLDNTPKITYISQVAGEKEGSSVGS